MLRDDENTSDLDSDFEPQDESKRCNETILARGSNKSANSIINSPAASASSVLPPQNGKKKLSQKVYWKRNQRKDLKTRGEEYVGRSGVAVAKKITFIYMFI